MIMQDNNSVQTASNYKELNFSKTSEELKVPKYLQETYWWAYVHPNAVQVFERQWLVNLILWGNFARLRDAALNELGQTIEGINLQVACVHLADIIVRILKLGFAGDDDIPKPNVEIWDVLKIEESRLGNAIS